MKLCRVQCHWDKSYFMVLWTYTTLEQIYNFKNYFNLPSLGGPMHKENKITPKLMLESYNFVSNFISDTTELSPHCHFNDISKIREILNIRKVHTPLKVDGSSFSLNTKFKILQRSSKLFQGECNVKDFFKTARSFKEKWNLFWQKCIL